MSRPTVVVIGAGLAGLAAAVRAADGGANIRLIERAPRLGGATWSFTHDGLTYDNGQHVFMRCCHEYLAFLDRIGSSDKVTVQARLDVPVRHAGGLTSRLRRAALPAPLHLGASLARYRHLGPLDRVRAARTALALRALDLDDPTLDTRTFGGWLAQRRTSRTAIEALWNLVCLPTVNLPADEASLLLAAKVFKTGLLDDAAGGDLGWSKVPLQELHGDAARATLEGLGVDVQTSTRVRAIRSEPGGSPSVVVDGDHVGADAVVVAVPHDTVTELLPPDSFDQHAAVAQLGRSPILNVHLLFDREVMDEPFFAGIDSPVQFVFDRTHASGAPDGHQCVAISLSAADAYLSWSRAELVGRFTDDLRALLPRARDAQVVTSMVTREVAATFRGAPGSAARRPGPHTRLPGVFLAGAWTDTGWPATMEGAVRSGNRAAAAVAAHIAPSGPHQRRIAA